MRQSIGQLVTILHFLHEALEIVKKKKKKKKKKREKKKKEKKNSIFFSSGPEIATVRCQKWVKPKLSGQFCDTNTNFHINTPKYI